MSVLSVQPTFPIFTEADGQPLENGYIWIGTANLDPQVNPIAVYWDAALTQPAAQPIRTINGYPAKSGSPGRLYVNSDYSIRVQNKNGSAIYSAPASTDKYSSELITFLQAGNGAVQRSVQNKLRETVSVKDFGAVGDWVTDDTAAFQAAIAYGASAGVPVRIPNPSVRYILTAGLTVDMSNTTLLGDGATLDFTALTTGKAITFTASAGYPAQKISALEAGGFVVNGGNYAAASGIYIAGTVSAQFMRQALFRNISVYRFGKNYEFGDYQYRIKLDHCQSVEANTYHVYFPSGTSNAGEVMTWHDCLFENGTGTSLYIRDGQFFFSDCSFLNCTIDLAGDNHTVLYGGNIEAPGYTGSGYRYVKVASAAYCELVGTVITISNPGTTITQAQFECSATEGGGLVFNGARIPMDTTYMSPQTTDLVKTFVAGDGRVQLKGAHLYDSFGARDFFPIATSCSVIYNGNAELNNTNGWATAAVAGSGALVASATAKKNGNYGFQISTVNANDVFEASQTFNVTPGRVVLCSMWYQNTTSKQSRVRLEGYSQNGTLTLYVQKILDGNGVWNNNIGTISRIVPAGTVTCKFIVQSFDQSVTYFDDVVVNVI